MSSRFFKHQHAHGQERVPGGIERLTGPKYSFKKDMLCQLRSSAAFGEKKRTQYWPRACWATSTCSDNMNSSNPVSVGMQCPVTVLSINTSGCRVAAQTELSVVSATPNPNVPRSRLQLPCVPNAKQSSRAFRMLEADAHVRG